VQVKYNGYENGVLDQLLCFENSIRDTAIITMEYE